MSNLAVPTLATEVPGNYLTAALWLANVTNALTFALNPPDFLGLQTVTQSLTNATWGSVLLDTESVDTYGGHSTSTNTSRYVGQVPGYYIVCGIAAFASNSTGGRGATLALNGTRITGAAGLAQAAVTASPTAIATHAREVFLNGTTDYVELQAFQVSTAALLTASTTDVASALYVRWSHV